MGRRIRYRTYKKKQVPISTKVNQKEMESVLTSSNSLKVAADMKTTTQQLLKPKRQQGDHPHAENTEASQRLATENAPEAKSLIYLQCCLGNRYVQRLISKAGLSGDSKASTEIEGVIERNKGGGQPLERGVRQQMETSLGADFSDVRVHLDTEADKLNRAVSARAFTTGHDIFFSQGTYDPGTSGGRELLTHELTHVVQQGGPAIKPKLTVSEPGDQAELEAEQVSKVVSEAEQSSPSTADTTVNRQHEVDSDHDKEIKDKDKGKDKVTHAIGEEKDEEQPMLIKGALSRSPANESMEIDRSTHNLLRDQSVASLSAADTVKIARKKESPSPFQGSAATADIRAAETGQAAGGVSPIKVSTDYTTQQAERKEKQMDYFRKADIPFVYDNQQHYGYKKLIELRQEYLNDVSRITLAQGAFNDFVVPGALANKSTAQFKNIQFELGYFDDVNPADELSDKERKTLAKNLDEKTIKTLNADISSKEELARGKRKEILGTSHNIQAAMQRRAGVLAGEAKVKAEKEQTDIAEKIKAVKDGAETVGKVIEAVSFAGFGGPAAISEIAEGGSGAIKGGLELGGKGTSLIGATAEFIMTEMYKEQIQKAKQEIEKAKVAETYAKKMDADLSLAGSMLTVEGQLEELSGAMGQLALALKARKDYFAKLGAETDKATGKKAGGKLSQYLVYVSQANETKSHIETAKASANAGNGVMSTQIEEMAKHRNYAYVADAAGVWDDRARKVDEDGPDLEQLQGARNALEGFVKSADKQLVVIDQVINSLPAPE